MKRVLVTGGAGFIGSHLADRLLASGWSVRVLDSLSEQVHGPGAGRPDYLDDRVELRVGDIRDAEAVAESLDDVQAVVHLAAAVGVGQSMYRIAEYVDVNANGTAVLLQQLVDRPVERLVVASSMSVYGEGRYRDRAGGVRDEVERTLSDLEAGRFEPHDEAGHPLVPVATPEDKAPALSSIYALNKYDQERMALIAGRAYRRPTVALRFFNTYGPRQALSNPYTGVLAIFASQLLNGRRPQVFEDGEQVRDFVSVHDVAQACVAALVRPNVAGEVLNIGSGQATSVTQVAGLLADVLGVDLEPEILGRYRVGDIRHCFADTSRAERVLGYRPQVALADGVRELGAWLEGQQAEDRSDQMRTELERRGLTL
jgi:dTDP-L-rhamnose 4-epimerase